jgi:hypothetical protein
MSARVEVNTKEMDYKQEEILARMREDIMTGQAEMRSTVCAIQPELKETIQRVMGAAIQSDETAACNEATVTEPDPGMMQSIEEHQEISKQDAKTPQ